MLTGVACSATTNQWFALSRTIVLFNTGALGAGATVSSATFSLYGETKEDAMGCTPNITVYASVPNSNTDLIASDYGTLGSTAFATAITYADWSSAGYNDYSLNASGLAAISLTGVTKLGTRNANYDVSGDEPAWSNSVAAWLYSWASEKGAGYKPKLVVTYTPAITFIPTSSMRRGIMNGIGRGI
jgi:hypothetical protein